MNTISQPTILVIVGISGDLSRRYLLPALRSMAKAGVLPQDFRIVGITRRKLKLEDILPEGNQQFLRDHLELYQMDLTDLVDYRALSKHLQAIERMFSQKIPAQRLLYISVPPQVSQPVVRLLGESGLASAPHTKLLLEKPFGTDLASAQELVDDIKKYFVEDQIYRIDHYLAKEMAQNLIIFRAANPLFASTWNKDFIERIDIVATEDIGIEGRVAFYEQTGALRDLVQSHLLQLAALTLMDLPKLDDWQAIPALRLRALQALQPPVEVAESVVRGQYDNYRQEVANPHSMVETFVSLKLASTDPRWQDVPVTITTGKALAGKTTEIRVQYRADSTSQSNLLVLRIQPNEGVAVTVQAKQPGYDRQVQTIPLSFEYKQQSKELAAAYERVFLDAMCSDHSLFTTSEEVLAAWRILAPIQHAWAMDARNLQIYASGSEGPS